MQTAYMCTLLPKYPRNTRQSILPSKFDIFRKGGRTLYSDHVHDPNTGRRRLAAIIAWKGTSVLYRRFQLNWRPSTVFEDRLFQWGIVENA